MRVRRWGYGPLRCQPLRRMEVPNAALEQAQTENMRLHAELERIRLEKENEELRERIAREG